MPKSPAILRRLLQAFGLGLSLLMIGAMSHALTLPVERVGAPHFDVQPMLLQVAGPRLVAAKAERVPAAPHPSAALVPTPIALPEAPQGGSSTLVPLPRLWTPVHMPTGWQARAPPYLFLQRRT